MGIGVDRYNAGKRLPKEIHVLIKLGDWPNPAQCLTFAMEIPATLLVETITFFTARWRKPSRSSNHFSSHNHLLLLIARDTSCYQLALPVTSWHYL